MLGEETIGALKLFGDSVVNKSKNNLRRKDKLASKKLHNSIDYDVEVHPNSLSLSFEMEDYWEFIDYGVKGVGGKKADGSTWKKKKVTNSKFKYKNKKPRTIFLNGWTIRKGIAPRDSKGRLMKRKGLLHAISTSIFHTGLETTSFFTKPFEKEFKELPDELIEAYALDVDDFLEFTIK